MKINDKRISSPLDNKINSTHKKQSTPESGKMSFQSHLREIKHHEIREKFDNLFKIIEEQGEKLKQSLDKKDLLSYKKSVREFLRLLQQEFSTTRQAFSWDSTGNFRTFTLAEKVDQNLTILHNLFMEEQADVLTIVKKIDEIRGLLMDLYI